MWCCQPCSLCQCLTKACVHMGSSQELVIPMPRRLECDKGILFMAKEQQHCQGPNGNGDLALV